jgi:hypothetical protein
MTDAKAAGPLEVWLTQNNLDVTCTVVREDESTEPLDIDSLSMRGAMREITGYLIEKGYKPVGRWSNEAMDNNGAAVEVMRRFKSTERAINLL